jgi:simple sugar transport system permease protein
LAYAALGELVAERAGVLNLGLEGIIIAGCLGALLVANVAGPATGLLASAFAGVVMAACFATLVLHARTDQIITGTALTLFGLGLTGTIFRVLATQGVSASTTTIPSARIPLLADLPLFGSALFDQPVTTYALYVLVPAMAWWMFRTHAGLALRAVGEHPEASAAAGVRPVAVRWAAILFSGLMGGLCGGTLVLAQVGSFNEGMSAGRGFIAIAIVVLGRWRPAGVAGAAAIFGSAFALQYLFQSLDLRVPYQLFLALPYLLTLILLATLRGRVAAPASLGR